MVLLDPLAYREMWIALGSLNENLLCCLFISIVTAALSRAPGAASIMAPSSACYVLDNTNHIYDFSTWIGHHFEYEEKESDLAIRFCKDVETRSQAGYIDFGRFDPFNHFIAGSGHVSFVQNYYYGDLINCENSYGKMGRTAQVNIICGSCSNGQCKGDLGCICNVTHESTCRVIVELAIPCEKQGQRVFKGFTVGFHPRSWEVVFNGMTQLGFEKSHHEFSFRTEQSYVALYMTAIASLSHLVRKPIIKVFPETGLDVKLSGSGASGRAPTTLSPTVLLVDWTCQQAHDIPYEVNFTVPVEGYEPIQFTLTKACEHEQGVGGDATRGWATFGVLSCIFIIFSSIICCGGFVYRTRVERQHGLDALPGMTLLSACLEALSGGGQGYARTEDSNSTFANQVHWEQRPASAQGTWKTSETKYGSV